MQKKGNKSKKAFEENQNDEKPLLSEDVTVEPEGIIPQNSEYDQYTILKCIEVMYVANINLGRNQYKFDADDDCSAIEEIKRIDDIKKNCDKMDGIKKQNRVSPINFKTEAYRDTDPNEIVEENKKEKLDLKESVEYAIHQDFIKTIKDLSEQSKEKSEVSNETIQTNLFRSEWKKPEINRGIMRNVNYQTEMDEFLSLDPDPKYVQMLVDEMKYKAKVEKKIKKSKNKAKADYYANKLEEGLEFLFN